MQLNSLVNNRLKTVALGMLAVVFAFAMQMALAPKAHATSYNLTPSPAPGDCNIYDAINAINTSAASGGCDAGTSSNTINLAAGTYTLIGTLPAVTFDGDLSINGASATTTIIDGGGFQGLIFNPSVLDTTVSMSNLSLQNFSSLNPAGTIIASFGGDFVGDKLLIHDNTCTDESIPVCALFINNGSGNNQSIRITNSAFYNNSALSLIAAGNVEGNSVDLDLVNNTFYGNDGLIVVFNNYIEGTTSTLNFVNNTVSNNNFPGGIGWLFLNSINDTGTSNVNVKNNIFNNNVTGDIANNCGVNTSTNGHIFTQGGNVSSDDTCSTIFNATNDKNSTDPQLAAPAMINNTYIMALNSGSPAIDNGIAGGLTPSTDQRGVARPQGSAPDSGAYELEVSTPGLPNTGSKSEAAISNLTIIAGLLVLSGIGAAGYSLKRK